MPGSAAHLIVIVLDSYFKPCARLDLAGLQERRIRVHHAFSMLTSVNGKVKVSVQVRRMWNFLLDNRGQDPISSMDTIVKGKTSYLFFWTDVGMPKRGLKRLLNPQAMESKDME